MNLLKTLDNGPHQSRVTSTKGHSIPPIRATTELTPRPMFRTEVGNNSTLIRYERASAPLTKNFPINNYMSVRNRFMIVRSLCNGAHDRYVNLCMIIRRKVNNLQMMYNSPTIQAGPKSRGTRVHRRP